MGQGVKNTESGPSHWYPLNEQEAMGTNQIQDIPFEHVSVTVRVIKLWSGCLETFYSLQYLPDIQNPSSQSPEQAAVGDPALSR